MLEEHFPGLKPNDNYTEVAGEVSFHASYDKESDLFSIIRPDDPIPSGVVLRGAYRVIIKDVIDLREGSRWLFPRVFIQDENFPFSLDRHFSGKAACLFGPSEEARLIKEGYSFLGYLEKYVLPFLYAQTYYDLHREWPWAEYEHDIFGALNSHLQSGDVSTVAYTLIPIRARKDWPQIRKMLVSNDPPRGHMLCFCERRDHIRRCHPELWEALKKFYTDFKRAGIKLPPL